MPLKIASPVSSQTSRADLLEETDGIIWATIEVPSHELNCRNVNHYIIEGNSLPAIISIEDYSSVSGVSNEKNRELRAKNRKRRFSVRGRVPPGWFLELAVEPLGRLRAFI
jgi:hypothetical protein